MVYQINSSRFQKEMFRLMYIMWVLYKSYNVFACSKAKLVSYSLFIRLFYTWMWWVWFCIVSNVSVDMLMFALYGCKLGAAKSGPLDFPSEK